MSSWPKIDLSSIRSSLDRVAIDPGSSFMQGGDTSLFKSGSVTIGRVTEPLLPWAPMPDPGELAKQVSSVIIDNVTKFAASYLASKTAELMAPPSLSDILGEAGEMMSSYLMSAEAVMRDAISDATENTKAAAAMMMSETITELSNTISDGLGALSEDVKQITEPAKEWAESISRVISQGPKYVNGIASTINDAACEQIEKTIAEKANVMINHKKQMMSSLAIGEARRLAAEQNDKMEKEARKNFTKVAQVTQKAENVATSMVKDNLMDMKASLGL